jgi:hypothetical protein
MNSNINSVIIVFFLGYYLTLQANEEELTYHLTPYAWFAGFEGAISTRW